MALPHITVDMRSGAEISVKDRWDPEKRQRQGHININCGKRKPSELTFSGAEAIALSNAFSKVAWEMARADLDMTEQTNTMKRRHTVDP